MTMRSSAIKGLCQDMVTYSEDANGVNTILAAWDPITPSRALIDLDLLRQYMAATRCLYTVHMRMDVVGTDIYSILNVGLGDDRGQIMRTGIFNTYASSPVIDISDLAGQLEFYLQGHTNGIDLGWYYGFTIYIF